MQNIHLKSLKQKESPNLPRNRLVLIRKRKNINSSINFLKYVKTAKSPDKIDRLIKKKNKIESEIKDLINEELQKKEIDAIKQMKRNPKFFYSYVKKFNKTESKIGPLEDENGNLQSEPDTKANLLQNQYIKVFSNPKNVNSNKEYNDK